jgi:RNA-binding protein 8A
MKRSRSPPKAKGVENDLARPGGNRDDNGEDEPLKRPAFSGGPIRSVEGWVVFVTGLHEETREDDVTDAFSDAIGGGPTNLVRVNFDPKTGKCKGYAIVEYGRQTEAQDAINKLHGTELLGKTIGVHWAFVKPSDGSRQSA